MRKLLLVGFILALVSPFSARAMVVEFQWDPVDQVVPDGAGSTTVILNAVQTGGADAAAITLGIAFAGAITGFDLLSYGSAVSAPDSACCDLAGTPGIIAVAPAAPGSFGQDVDFEIATFTLFYDLGLDASGTVSLLDLSSVAGAPAVDSDVNEIPSNLSAVHTVIPEPSTVLLVLVGLTSLAATRHR